MQASTVCRLCSSSESLIFMFDERIERRKTETLRTSIRLATGLNIREDDIVSKMVCHRCCEIAVKLHKYRANAVANDKLLKEQCGQSYVPPATDQDELRRLSAQILTSNGKMFATPYGLPPDGRLLLVDPKNKASHEALELLNVCVKTEPVDNIPIYPEPYKHDSVKELYKKYSGIILPEAVYKCDIAPVVTLDESEVEEWAEEEFKRVQQKLSWAKIIIQKVGETSANDKGIETAVETKPNLHSTFEKKRPGPKSKTLGVTVNPKPPPVVNDVPLPPLIPFVKSRPGPKSKTVDLAKKTSDAALKDKAIENTEIIYNKPGPKSMKPEALSPTLYRPGPKSRKADLVLHSTGVKPIVHESHLIKAAEMPTSSLKQAKIEPVANKIPATKDHSTNNKHESKVDASSTSREIRSGNKMPATKDNSSNNKFESKVDASSSSREIRSNNKVLVTKDNSNNKHESNIDASSSRGIMNKNMESDDDDEDFDLSSAIMHNDDSFSSDGESEILKAHLSKTKEVDSTKKTSSRRSARFVRSETESEHDFRETYKTRLTSKSDKGESKTGKRSLHSRKRSSSIESGKSDESVKKRRISSKSENDKLESRNKMKVQSSNKTEIKSAKTDVPKSNIHKSEEPKRSFNKDDLSKSSSISKEDSSRRRSSSSSKEDLSKRSSISKDLSKRSSSKEDLPKKSSISKDDLSKKNRTETVKSLLEKKAAAKTIVNDKKELPSSTNNREVSKSSTSDKKVLFSTPVPEKAKPPSDDAPSLMIGRATKIYMCHTCCKLFDTNKELSEHQKSHLICKYCNYRMKNLETLKKHQNENCRMNVKRQQPTLKLTKVDKIKSIVNQYPKAFDDDDENRNDSTAAINNVGNTNVKIAQSLPVLQAHSVPKPQVAPQSQPLPPPQVATQLPIVTEIKSEIVCISDEDEDDVQCVDPANEVLLLPKSFLELPLSGMTENDMIRSLFNKHLKAGVSKFQRASQTFLPRPGDVKYTNSNLIVLENLFDELYTYKIPVQLEIRPKISARFTEEILPSPKANLECWAHIQAVTVSKPKPVVAPKPVWIAPAKFQTSSSVLSAKPASVAPTNSKTNVKRSNRVNSPSPILPTTQPILSSNISPTNLNVESTNVLSPSFVLPTTEAVGVFGTFTDSKEHVIGPDKFKAPSTTQPFVSSNLSQTNLNVIEPTNVLSPSFILPTTQGIEVFGNFPETNKNVISPAKFKAPLPTMPALEVASKTSETNADVIKQAQFHSSILQTMPDLILIDDPLENNIEEPTVQFHSSSSISPDVVSSSPTHMTNVLSPGNFQSPSSVSLPTLANGVVSNSTQQTNTSVSSPANFHPPPVLPTTQALVVSSSPSSADTNTVILNNLLNSSPSVPSLLPNSNLFISTNNSFLPSLNGPNKSPRLLSFMGNSTTSTTNLTTTLIQTSNNGTLFMQNGISPNSTTIIQTPNNATLIQTPNAAVIQTGNSTAFITPPNSTSASNMTLATNSINAPVSTQSSMVLMQTVPQASNQGLIRDQSTINSNNLVFQTPTEQIYQINNAGTNVNKVVVFSNTLSNGIQQNMPLYATPYLSDFPQSSVSIEEIEDNPQNNDSSMDVVARNKTTIRIKPSWELY